MFRKVMSLIAGAVDIAPPKDVVSFKLGNSVAGVEGSVYKFDDGALVLATADEPAAAIVCLENATAAGYVRGSYIAPGAVYLAPITKANGSEAEVGDLDSGFLVGARVNINATGDGVDGATSPDGGPLTVLKIDKVGMQCWVVFNSCAMNTGAAYSSSITADTFKVSGTVVDDQEAAVAGATVVLAGTGKVFMGLTAADTGAFEVEVADDDTYTLLVSAPTFKPYEHDTAIVVDGADVVISGAIELEEVE